MSKSKHILIVDDNEIGRMTVASFMAAEGFEVFEAKDGQEALDILRSNAPVDLVLMDLRMPNLDGPSATTAIRADPQLSMLPVFAYTAQEALYAQHRRLFDGVFIKPILPSEIVRAVRDRLRSTANQ